MPFRILRYSTYERLLEAFRERDKLRGEREAYEESIRRLAADADVLREERDKALCEVTDFEKRVAEEVQARFAHMGVSRHRFEQLAADRAELVELYIERLYSLACRFAQDSIRTQHNRGLFILLVDRRNANPQNFSEFYEGQREYLDHEEFRGIERLPHIFSTFAYNLLEYMGGKELRLSKEGNVLGFEERDGALLVDLRGVIYQTRQMVEGVRSHKVYSKVERLMGGSARHNAAIYASSLDEVLVSIVVSEETNIVTIFRDGKYVEAYDPYEDAVITREEYFDGKVAARFAQPPAARPRRPSVEDTEDIVSDVVESSA